MATYYVQPNGIDSNTGLGPSNSTAWKTVQKALGATGINSGDTLYIAPGTYREAITIAGTYSARTTIIGDRTSSQFSGIPAGYVRITGLVSDALNAGSSFGNFTTNGKSYLTFDSLWLEHAITVAASSSNITFIRCQMTTPAQVAVGAVILFITTTGQSSILFDKCYIQGGIRIDGAGTSTTTRFNACILQVCQVQSGSIEFLNSGASEMIFSNCTIFGGGGGQIFRAFSSSNLGALIYNCLIVPDYQGATTFGGGATSLVEDYNAGYISRLNISAGLNTKQLYHRAFTHTPIYINPVDASIIPYTPLASGSLTGAGSPAYSFGTDYFGNPWSNPPSIGAMELKNYSIFGTYQPTERNASVVTVPSGATSQSVELYLGVTGLTATTAGLNAYYNKNRTADVAIPLVARTIAQPWVAGGFAEVNQTTMPGVYRLDIPNEAVSSGYGNTTVVVRGATGTNGAVLTIQETPTLGYQIKMGPFTVQADGILTDDRLKLIQGSVHSIDFKMVDAYGTGVDGTGTVVTAKVYNAAGFLIDTYTCTAMYALDGRYSFAIDSTVTDNVGMYTINIYRQIGTETNVFGRMKLEVLSP
jgi:hypothetical protein